ncbi:MAG: ParB N-terminal domain-containing protein [Planctomycetota bacterium]
MAEAGPKKKKATRRRKKKEGEPASRGLTPEQVAGGAPPAAVRDLQRGIESDGGRVLAIYRDPLGGGWQVLAALPIDRVRPTPFQRDLSETHVARLADAIDQLDRFLDPVIAVRSTGDGYWTPNGHHRLASMRRLGARSIVALVVPLPQLAFRILALNTEKAHNIKERSLEVIRMARGLADLDPRPEQDFSVEFEEPALLTLGACYEKKARFSGGAYHPVLKRVEAFLAAPLPGALETREARAARLLELDEAVLAAVVRLKERGLESPYLKAFVIARVNPLRFRRGAAADFDETIDKMTAAAKAFDPGKVKSDQLARAGGPPG